MNPKFWLLTIAGIAGVITAYWYGFVAPIYSGSHMPLTIFITFVFFVGLSMVLLQKWAHVEWIAKNVTKVALIGTVIGFVIALNGVAQFKADDANTVGPMMKSVFTGMGVSLYATLLGLVSNIWLRLNMHLLRKGD